MDNNKEYLLCEVIYYNTSNIKTKTILKSLTKTYQILNKHENVYDFYTYKIIKKVFNSFMKHKKESKKFKRLLTGKILSTFSSARRRTTENTPILIS